MSDDTSWEKLKSKLNIGTVVTGVVTKHEPYGVYVNIGYSFDGLIQITDFKSHGVMTTAEYPPINSEIKAKVLGYKEVGKKIWLGIVET